MKTFKHLKQIKEELEFSYSYIVVPKAMLDAPVPHSKMTLINENGEDDGYGSINELSQSIGTKFKPVPRIDERFSLFRWLIRTDLEAESMVTALFENSGLVNMKVSGQESKDIDYPNLQGNEFGIFDAFSIRDVPQFQEVKEVQ